MLNLLESQLSFFGAIDEAVVHAQQGGGENPDAVLRIVEAMLPHTTGFGQAGWYRELQQFASRPGVRVGDSLSPPTFPSVPQALRYLEASTAGERQQIAVAAIKGDRDSTLSRLPERVDNEYDPLHDPVLARCAYAAMVVENIRRHGGLPPSLGITVNTPARIMASAINAWLGSPKKFAARDAKLDKTVQKLFSPTEQVVSRESWQSLATNVVDSTFAAQSLPCFGTLVNVDGQYCSTLYTEATHPTLSVDNIKEIVDPRNWSLCCKFFCHVVAQDPPYDKRGWSRILEKIGPECSEWCLKTALLFYFALDGNGGIFINYTLDPHRQDDSGLVEVDNGYIWVTPLEGTDSSAKGVRIRTSKQERVQGLSPTATSALGCLLGWADAANELLAGTALLVLSGKIPSAVLQPFITTPPLGYESQTDSGAAQPAIAARATLPPYFGHTVGDVRTLVNDLIDDTRDVVGDAANRWLKGMTREDVEEITDRISTDLREFALEAYQTAVDNVKPRVTTAKKDGSDG